MQQRKQLKRSEMLKYDVIAKIDCGDTKVNHKCRKT